jgi:hypothetical protein
VVEPVVDAAASMDGCCAVVRMAVAVAAAAACDALRRRCPRHAVHGTQRHLASTAAAVAAAAAAAVLMI